MWSRLWAWIIRHVWPMSRFCLLESRLATVESEILKLHADNASLHAEKTRPRKKLEVWKHPVAVERAMEERLKHPPWFRPSP